MRGVLPYQRICELLGNGSIKGGRVENVSSDRLDLTCADLCYRLKAISIPRRKESIDELLTRSKLYLHPLDCPLEPGVPYIIKLNERFVLPANLRTLASPKSSVGRMFLHARLIGETGGTFDRLPRGYNGSLWAIIVSRFFPVFIRPGVPMLQIRFFYGNPRLNREELVGAYQQNQFIWLPNGEPIDFNYITIDDEDGGFLVRLDLENDSAGWKAKKAAGKVFDFSAPNATYDPSDFFEIVKRPESGCLLVDAYSGYLLNSYEYVRFSEEFCGEVEAFDTGIGDIRLHSAGFFDTGFGYGASGSVKGTPATLEIMAYEDKILFAHKQRILKFFVNKMLEKSEKIYGDQTLNSSYLFQRGPRLPKQFKQP